MAMPRQTTEALAPWLAGWPPAASDEAIPADLAAVAEDLLGLGIFTTSPRDGKPVCAQNIHTPLRGIPATDGRPPIGSTFMAAAASARASHWAGHQLSKYSLRSLIQHILDRRPARAESNPDFDLRRASSLVDAFRRWHVFFSRPSACLFESLSLLHFLSTYRFFPSLVFGVISDPFQAHCWLQYRSILINDRLSRVQNFTPIMLV